MTTTIKDIANKAGVSVTTVSRVLNNHPYVKDEIRARVLKVIDEEHFVPHNAAVDLVKAQTDTIGLLVRGMGNQFFQEIITVMEKSIEDSGYTCATRQIRTEDDELRAAAAFAKEKKLKGIILLGGKFDWAEEEAKVLDIPFVCCTFNNIYGESGQNRYSSVSIDDKEEAYRAVKFLLDHGHERIAIVLAATDDRSVSQLRYEGYRQALLDAGIQPDEKLVRTTGSYDMEEAYDATIALVEEHIPFTAIFSISDTMAMAATKALIDAGKSVPEQCSVIAIDGVELSKYMIPTLTTIVQPSEEIAQNAVEILAKLITGKSKSMHLLLRADIREGGSVMDLNTKKVS